MQKGKFDEWVRPEPDDVQPVQIAQLLPVKVSGTWDFRKRQPVYSVSNVKTNEAFSALMED